MNTKEGLKLRIWYLAKDLLKLKVLLPFILRNLVFVVVKFHARNCLISVIYVETERTEVTKTA